MLDYYGVMRFIRVIFAASLALFGSLLVSTSALGHADVVSTSPTADSEIDVAPATISISFSEPVLEVGAAIVLADSSGSEIGVGEVTFEGATMSVSSPPDLAPGEYIVTWRASSNDGHVMTGEFGFTFNGTVVVASPVEIASPMAQSGARLEDTQKKSSNAWIYLLASFVATSTIATIIATKKRK